MIRRVLVTLAAAMALLAASVGSTQASTPAEAAPPLPTSMASTGDSLTRAYDVDWWHLLRDDPAESWATGNDDSQYTRLVPADPAIAGHAYNLASSGAQMSALDAQLGAAASRHVGYVTVLMGANDLCTSSIASMTPTATFAAEFGQSLADFSAADPDATVFVSSIPNIYQLWSTEHSSFLAQLTWRIFGICQSMLAPGNTEAQRQEVVAQEQADNTALAAVCAAYPQCHWDGLATYRVDFTPDDISSVDYFHPSVAGQHLLAATTWQAGPFAAVP